MWLPQLGVGHVSKPLQLCCFLMGGVRHVQISFQLMCAFGEGFAGGNGAVEINFGTLMSVLTT